MSSTCSQQCYTLARQSYAAALVSIKRKCREARPGRKGFRNSRVLAGPPTPRPAGRANVRARVGDVGEKKKKSVGTNSRYVLLGPKFKES
jgi:hypothetical protein